MALATQELMPSKNGNEETGLATALKGIRVVNSTLEEFKSVLRYCMLKVGIRAANIPNDEEKMILLQHIISEYGNHTIAEIRLAFDMAITGKLDIDRKEVICYENFSCLYFSGVMDSYRRWSSQAYRHVIKELPAPVKTYSKQEILMDYAEYLWKTKQKEYKQRLLPPLK